MNCNCKLHELPGVNLADCGCNQPQENLNDLSLNLLKVLGVDSAVDQVGKSTEAAENINKTINKTLDKSTETWQKSKPYVMAFAGVLVSLMVVTTIKNFQEIEI